jgi:RNA polymerase sigma-70 factor (ECF subfamily)
VEIDRAYREVSGTAVATLIRVFGDVGLAEDAVHDAFVVASQRWNDDGIPPNPAGWIITTAKRRAIDHLRRSARGTELLEEAALTDSAGIDGAGSALDDAVSDDRLRLFFTCCHPALRTEHQVALTLRLLGGLSIEQVAEGFVVSPAAMSKRLTRAKYKIAAASIPYRVPDRDELPERLRSVLMAVSLIYTAGNPDPSSGELLRSEAIRLARSLAALLPEHPETDGLLALLLLNESRVPARATDESAVLLTDQNRSRWDHTMIVEGQALVRRCIRRDQPGPFQLQAAIQAVHANAPSSSDTDWPQIVTIYDHLTTLMPTPIVAMNRAIAIGERTGPEAGLIQLDAIQPALDRHARFHAARASMLIRLDRDDEASAAYQQAAEWSTSDRDRETYEDLAHVLRMPPYRGPSGLSK